MPKRFPTSDPLDRPAAELRAIRQHLALTQRQLALMLGVTARSLCRWELGQRPVPASILQLARFYALWTAPLHRFLPDPTTLTLHVEASTTCLWASAGPCHGHCFALAAQISRRRRVTTATCQAHLSLACQGIEYVNHHKRLPLRRLGHVVEAHE